jgi:hypothetical protein
MLEAPEGVEDLDVDEIGRCRGAALVEHVFLYDIGTRKAEQEVRYR